MPHHDNAPAHASLLVCEFLMKTEMTVVPHLPYSPDLVPADFFPFPKLKSTLKGRRFQTEEEIKENSLQDLRAISQNTFQDAFQNWKKRWSRGEYFEGDKSD
jgi:transposase